MSKYTRPGQKIQLKNVNELLGVVNEESAMDIEIEKISPFKDHPFKVTDDEKMQDLVESIRVNGILTPVLIRPAGNDQYEMVSGHRRMHAAQVLGLKRIPAFIREMTDDEATVRMVDSNIQREELLPSEKAFAYKMKMDAIAETGIRNDLTSAQNDPKLTSSTSRTLLAEQFGDSGAQVSRYIRLTELISMTLSDLVDKKRLPFTVAVEISYIDPEVQGWLYEYIRENGQVKLNQISALRDQMKTGVISQSKMIEILNNSQPGRLPSLKLTFTENNLREFFPEGYSVSQMRSVIEDLLSEWKMNREEGGLYEV